MIPVLRNIVDNPILLRELRRRMRGKALIYSIISYIIVLTATASLILLVTSPSPFAETSIETLNQMKRTGEALFAWITGIQTLLVLVIAPTITAGLTTGEKERRTFDFLRVTTITNWMYILGCFLSTAFYVGLALICALPHLSLSFLYGGVSLTDVVRTFLFLLAGSWVLSAFGLYVSSIQEKTRTAQGIIVFGVFALGFITLFLLGQFRATFAGAAAAATAAGNNPTGGGVFFFDFLIPVWFLIFTLLCSIAGLFLLLAARKLFEPEDTRALGHGQFAILLTVYFVVGFMILGANTFLTEAPELLFLGGGYLFLLGAVMCFAVGRMEVGDEIWHLKRMLRWLRPIDQTIPFLIIVGAAWFVALRALPSLVSSTQLSEGFFAVAVPLTLLSFATFCLVGRAVSGVIHARRRAGQITLAVLILVLVVIPALVAALAIPLDGTATPMLRELWVISPFALFLDALFNPTAYSNPANLPGSLAMVVYTAAILVVGAIGERIRWKRWRGFDFHYDMPARID